MTLVPDGVVTWMSTGPALAAGAIAVIDVPLLTVNEVAAVEPKVTEEAAVKPAPVTAIEVAPVNGPEVGTTAVTVGIAS